MSFSLNIRVVPGRYAVCRLDTDAAVPDWLQGSGFKAVVCSEDEVTLVCLETRVPRGIPSETGWACLRTIGPFPFDTAGIVKSLIDPLSRNDIGVFVICTFDGEHVLIPSHKLDAAKKHLEAAGHTVLPALSE
nr:ACT domain-containing protein [uncultured Cohaesibacter sp.]